MMAGQRGFTLMEMLIAVTITAMIGLGVWQVLNGVINARDRVDEVADEFAALQHTMLLFERDMNQMINRPARDVFGDMQPALTSRSEPFNLLLTRQGWRNPLGQRRSNLQRVAWEYDGNALVRSYWPALDQGQDDNRRQAQVLEGLKTFKLRFLDSNRQWRDNWPVQEPITGTRTVSEAPALPLGLELTIEHDRFGTLERLFVLTDFDADKAQASLNRSVEGSFSDSVADDEASIPAGGQ
ncbi:MAG TPA: type II secretion system minor pseudopilin GspJ, partial [Marinobacter sp.]|nr:type II secretion system minor pseudopilin GspJ [Marinobacter sp.]